MEIDKTIKNLIDDFKSKKIDWINFTILLSEEYQKSQLNNKQFWKEYLETNFNFDRRRYLEYVQAYELIKQRNIPFEKVKGKSYSIILIPRVEKILREENTPESEIEKTVNKIISNEMKEKAIRDILRKNDPKKQIIDKKSEIEQPQLSDEELFISHFSNLLNLMDNYIDFSISKIGIDTLRKHIASECRKVSRKLSMIVSKELEESLQKKEFFELK